MHHHPKLVVKETVAKHAASIPVEISNYVVEKKIYGKQYDERPQGN